MRWIIMGTALWASLIMGAAQANLDTLLSELLGDYVDDEVPGVVLYVNRAGDEWIGARGLANLETDTPLQTDDLFRIGSITKPMVATVVLQLVEAGNIALDDPIAPYLPEVVAQGIVNADTITVRQMLQMTSGVFDYIESDGFDDAVYSGAGQMWTANTAIQYAFGEQPYFAPGDGYYYSNSNYLLAELIIESVAGQSLAEALEARIFVPLGMTSCFVETPQRFAEGIVRGYTLLENGYEDITDINDGTGMGDGGVICNATDLAKFPPALWFGDLLGEDMIFEMIETVDDGEGGLYGLGIGYEENALGLMQLSHAGSTSGFNADMIYIPSEDLSVVIMTNDYDTEIIEDLTIDAQLVALDL